MPSYIAFLTYRLENNFFATSEHGGTHFDAPAHLYKGAWRSHQIPIQQLAGPGVVLDVRDKVATNPDYEVTIQDLEDWESRNGRIPYGFVVVMNSGWDKKYPNKTAVFGSNNSLDSSTFHFPGFSPAACEWLVHNRNIHVIGVDTPSLDYGQSTDGLSHVIISKVNIVILENVAYLGTIPEAGIIIFFGAMKVYDGSGVPARVFALVSEGRLKFPFKRTSHNVKFLKCLLENLK